MIVLLLFAGLAALLLCIFIVYIILIRAANPHSKKLDIEKTKTNEKSKGNDSDANKSEWFIRNFWTILFFIAGAFVLFFGVFGSLLKTPSFSEVGGLGHAKWIWILILCGILYALIAFNAKTLGKAAKTLQNILATTAITLLVLGLFTSQCSGPRTVPPPPQANTNVSQANTPVSEWKKIVLPPGGKSELIPVPLHMHIVMDGENFLLHNVYQDGHERTFGGVRAAGPLVGAYATNKVNEKNTISYSFAPN